MDPENITENVLAGLHDEYKPEIDAIHGRETTISFVELHERLLNREAMLLCKKPATGLDVPITANPADTRPRHSNSQNNWRGPNHHNNNHNYSNLRLHYHHRLLWSMLSPQYQRQSYRLKPLLKQLLQQLFQLSQLLLLQHTQ